MGVHYELLVRQNCVGRLSDLQDQVHRHYGHGFQVWREAEWFQELLRCHEARTTMGLTACSSLNTLQEEVLRMLSAGQPVRFRSRPVVPEVSWGGPLPPGFQPSDSPSQQVRRPPGLPGSDEDPPVQPVVTQQGVGSSSGLGTAQQDVGASGEPGVAGAGASVEVDGYVVMGEPVRHGAIRGTFGMQW